MLVVAVSGKDGRAFDPRIVEGCLPERALAVPSRRRSEAGEGIAWAVAAPVEGGATPVHAHVDRATRCTAVVWGTLFGGDGDDSRVDGAGIAERILRLAQSGERDWPRRLNGYFAAIIHDPRDGTTTVARDSFGVAPLYWRRVDGGFAFASAAKALFGFPGTTTRPNDALIARYLLEDPLRSTGFSGAETYFDEISRVAPGHVTVFGNGAPSQTSFVDPGAAFREPKQVAPDAAAYLGLLDKVTREQAGDFDGVGSALSGGLDSPALFVLLARAAGAQRQVPTVSLGNLGHGVDESGNINAVLAGYSTRHYWARPENEDMFAAFGDATWHQECPTFNPSPAVFFLVKKVAAQHGIRRLFSGLGADEVLGGLNLGYLADLFWSGRWIEFARQVNAYHKVDSLRLRLSRIGLIREQVFDPLSLFRSRVNTPAWIRRDVVAHHGLDRPRDNWARIPGLDHFDSRVLTLLTRTFTPTFLHYEIHNALAWGMENRFPYIDPRMVAYTASLPWQERATEGIYKIHHRKALKELVPEQIWKQEKKTLIPTVHDHWLLDQCGEQVREIIHGKARWSAYLDAAEVRRQYDIYRGSQDFMVRNRHRRPVWRAVSLELWLNAFWPSA